MARHTELFNKSDADGGSPLQAVRGHLVPPCRPSIVLLLQHEIALPLCF